MKNIRLSSCLLFTAGLVLAPSSLLVAESADTHRAAIEAAEARLRTATSHSAGSITSGRNSYRRGRQSQARTSGGGFLTRVLGSKHSPGSSSASEEKTTPPFRAKLNRIFSGKRNRSVAAGPPVPEEKAPKAATGAGDREPPAVASTRAPSPEREKPAPRASAERPDLGKVVSRLLQGFGPGEHRVNDDDVLSTRPDTLSLLSHRNIQPITPVRASQPMSLPGTIESPPPASAAGGKASPAGGRANPRLENRSSWLVALVQERLRGIEESGGGAGREREREPDASPPAPRRSPGPSRLPGESYSSERISLLAMMAVQGDSKDGARDAGGEAPEPPSRANALSLLAVSGEVPEEPPVPESPTRDREGLPEIELEDLEPVDEVEESQRRIRAINLLAPDSFASVGQ